MKKAQRNVMLVFLISLCFIGAISTQAEDTVEIEVTRSPSCGCCAKWVEHLKKNNFKVKDIVTDNVQALKDKYGISEDLASCHTAVVNGYAIEGHVPVDDIKALLKKKPNVVGISAPGMPKGSPGMEMGGQQDAYDIVSFDKQNQHQVFHSYPAK